jgi:crotonobetainyl-CoA:carnitine CoA-transferase CaiB-like acyl-CoA transferase
VPRAGRGAPDADARLDLRDDGAWLGGPLDVDGLACDAVAAALLAAAELAEARGLGRPAVTLSAEHVAVSFTSERHARVRGEPAGAGFAPLSRMVRCAGGGWARTHANYPHHEAALRRALGIGADVGELEAAAAQRTSVELEEAVVAAGGCAAALRTEAEWAAHPAGAAAGRVESGVVRPEAEQLGTRWGASASRPALGVRVLDLTRVIAGPVAGRTLAALGAEVLRIDPPGLPELPAAHLDTGPGKRSALLDLADAERREALLAGADVLLTGYRPGALDRFALAERHPQLVHVSLSAWGHEGPWAHRRGFDSLVQVASGIAAACAAPDGTPGVLPAQALDHGTGHLMAAAALRGLAARERGEAVPQARLSLARTAADLLARPRRDEPARRPDEGDRRTGEPARRPDEGDRRTGVPARRPDEGDRRTGVPAPRPDEGDRRDEPDRRPDPDRFRVAFGDVELIAPPGALDGVPLAWAHGPRPLGSDLPAWLPRAGSSSG